MRRSPTGRRPPILEPRTARRCLLSLLWFGAMSAVIGGVLGVVFNGAGLPLEYLDGTPFRSFMGPGLILGVVVGGTQLIGAVTLNGNRQSSAVSTAVAGFGMIIWIFAELALLGEFSWLQVIYFALGIVEIILLLILLDSWPSSQRPRRHALGVCRFISGHLRRIRSLALAL